MLDKNSEKDKVTFNRLMLSKSLYQHGLEHSMQSSALDKMIAVHNFHNAIEIMLRTIILHCEIRPEKELNITFENMLNEIDKNAETKLPYRQQIMNLNNLRNLVQHHAVEPQSATMDEWRVYSKDFLVKTFNQYFGISFDELSLIDFIKDENLCSILKEANAKLDEGAWQDSIIQSKVAFIHASKSITKFLPPHFHPSPLSRIPACRPQILSEYSKDCKNIIKWQFEQIDKKIEELYKGFNEKQFYSVILSTGVRISDLKKFYEIKPIVNLSINMSPIAFSNGSCSTEEESQWILDFVLRTIMKWQLLGLEPVAETNG